MVVERKGCTVIEGSNLIILDHESRLQWYLSNRGPRCSLKSDKKTKNLDIETM